MNHFQIPSLNKGILSQDDGLAIYRNYLTTQRKDHNGLVRRPCRSGILRAMNETHDKQITDASFLIQSHVDSGGKLWFWSDQHFNHNNIIKYASRPFEGVAHMNNLMITNYLTNVQDEDMVIFGGDVAFGELEDVIPLINYLPGKKILVLGNHDFDKNKLIFRDYGIFDAITMSCVYHKEIGKKICNLLITHYPIENGLLPKNTLNIHGHIHQYKADSKNINIAVEHTGYSPKNLDSEIENCFLEFC